MWLYFTIICISYLAIGFSESIFAPEWGADFESADAAFIKRINSVRQRMLLPQLPKEHKLSIETQIFGMCLAWLQLSFRIVHEAVEILLMGPYPLAMWVAAKEFEDFFSSSTQSLEEQKDSLEVLKEISEKYEKLKAFSKSLNGLWGKLYFIWVLEISMREIFLFDDGVISPWKGLDFLHLGLVVYTAFFKIMSLVLAADVFVKVNLC